MANAVMTVEQYKIQVLPPEQAQSLYASLPHSIRPEVFDRNLMNALMANPDLMRYPAALIYREVAKAALLGLLLDPILGEAYLVPAYNGKSKQIEPQLRVGYKGMQKLARQTGAVSNIYCHEVCQLDHVEADLGFPKVFHHKPKLFGNRGPIIGYAAVITFKDGTFDFEPMSLEECLAIRDRSDAWKAFKADRIKSTPWATDENEMCKKTAMRRLLKRQEQSPELMRAIQLEDEAEFPTMGQVEAPAQRRVPSAPAAPAIEHTEQKNAPAPSEKRDISIPYTIDIASGAEEWWTDFYIERLQSAPDAATLKAWNDANKQPLDALYTAHSELYARIHAAYGKHKKKITPKKASTKKKNDPISSDKQETGPVIPDPKEDYDGFLTAASKVLSDWKGSHEQLVTFWDGIIEPAGLMPPDKEDLLSIFTKTERAMGDAT